MNPHETKQKIAAHPSPKTKPARRAYRPGWLWFSLALLLTLSAGAVLQPPHPDPWRTTQGLNLISLDGWRYPVEYNAFKRLPVIHGNLHAVHVRPDGRHVWAVGDAGLIVHSADGGANWEQQYPKAPVLPSVSWVDWLARPAQAAEPSKVLADPAYPEAKTNRVFIKPPPDRALQDQKVVPINKAAKDRLLSIKADARAVVHGQAGADVKPAQTGAAAQTQPAKTAGDQAAGPVPTQQPAKLNSIFFVDDTDGWAVGDRGLILATRDGGKNWAPQINPNPSNLSSVHFVDERHGWAVGAGGTILSLIPGAAAWVPQIVTSRSDLASVHFVDARHGWAAGANGTILATSDGMIWAEQASDKRTELRAVHFADTQRGWALGLDGTMLVTRDGGGEWKTLEKFRLTAQSLFFADAQHGWVVGWGDAILATLDGGTTWNEQVTARASSLNSVYFADALQGWAVGAFGTILATHDGGKHWLSQTIGEGALAYMAANNGGKTWRDVEYARYPALWYYLGLVVCLVTFVRGLEPAEPDGKRTEDDADSENRGAAGLFVSDQPWKPGDPDHLGHGALAVGLSRFLRNENTEPGLTLAITGSWGSGKSSIMKRLQHDLEHAHFRPAWFNAWHHQQEGRQLASMFSAIRRQAIRAWYTPAGFWLRIRLLWARGWGYRMILGLTLAVLVVGVGDAAGHEDMLKAHWRSYVLKEPQTVLTQASLEKLKKDGALNEADLVLLKQRAVWQVPAGQGGCTAKSADRNATACVFESPGHLLESLEKSLLKRSLSQEEQMAVLAAAHHLPPAELFPHLTVIVALLGPLLALLMGKGLAVYGLDLLPWVRRFLTDGGAEAPKAAVGTLEHYRREFELLTHALKGRLVLFIDDLDRCTPETVREVLELVNYLVSAGQCFIVLGMAMEHVEACIEPKDKTQNQDEYAKQYLKKLINIEAPVPLATAEGIGKLLEGFRARASKGVEKKPGHTAVLAWLRRRGANESVMNLAAALSQRARSAMNIAWSRVSQGLGFVLPATPPLALCTVLAWGLLIREAPKPLEFAEPVVAQASVSAADRGNSGDTATAQAPERKDSGPVGVMAAQTYDPAKALRLPLGFVGLVALSSFWLYGYRKELFDLPERTADSDEFVTALDAWRDIIRLGDPTPRGVKRFVNRARLFSMQVEAMRTPDDEVMRESVLVGLAALHHLNEGLVEHTAGFSMRSMDDDARRSLEEKLGKPWKEIDELIDSVTVKLSDEHGAWAPTEAECRAFLSLARGVYIR